MPRLEDTLVVRDDLNGSPGWRHGEWRFLLQSFGGVAVDHIPWPRKGATKKRVASQPTPDAPVIPGFEQLMAIDVLDLTDDDMHGKIQVSTLVAAYAIDAHTGDSELYLGRPRYNEGGTHAWHWRVRLDDGERDSGRGAKPMAPAPESPAPQNVEDAEVRLRQASQEAGSRKDGG